MNPFAKKIAEAVKVKPSQAEAAIQLFDEGNTIPFIARYRKERTDTLDEEQLRQIAELLSRFKAVDERRETILASIEEQGKLTDELRKRILQVESLTDLEDLYLPYKPKRKTRASVARENGLQGLADLILGQELARTTADAIARSFLTDSVITIEEALQGARDIVAETISDDPIVRQETRKKGMQWGTLRTKKIETAVDEKEVFKVYYEFEGRVDRLRPHQVLAINRGETVKLIKVSLDIPERDVLSAISARFHADRRSPFFDHLLLAGADAADRLLLPAIERDIRRMLTEQAEGHAIKVFSTNLRALLNQPPLTNLVVLGLDPGFRTGCKVAVVDTTGKVLDTGTIYPHEPQKRWNEALETLQKWVSQYGVSLISIGNGTASRETEKLAAELIKKTGKGLQYIITNEAGASIYSASPLARAELPGLDVSLRGAVSIARRVQDPLAELVKIDPKSIGIGMYQHDVDQTELGHTLTGVVESAVNQVGVDVNTASPALLTYVSGIGPKLAEKIVAYRDAQGIFLNRSQLRQVSGLGPKAFEQAAGFLRIHHGDQPLDASAIHPESYKTAQKLLKLAQINLEAPILERAKRVESLKQQSLEPLARQLECGLPTLNDILEQLVRPGRDPRKDLPLPILRSDVESMDDLSVGMQLKGTVRNVVDFGSFVDIGVKQDALLHISQLPPGTLLEVGAIIELVIVKVEPERGRISVRLAGDW